MKTKLSIFLFSLAMFNFSFDCNCETKFEYSPDGTYLYASKDGEELFLDIYYASKGSEKTVDNVRKPSIIFMFGGGFKDGKRDKDSYKPWFKEMNAHGYTVISIDYRQGLKEVKKMGLFQSKILKEAIDMAVEDLFTATAFIADNSAELYINPENLVISGSSAGAITVLQAEWEAVNGGSLSSILPEGFRYRGVMAFAGAVFSDKGAVRYSREPAPTLLFHGTKDKVVSYKGIDFLNIHLTGSAKLCKLYERGDFNYGIIRFDRRGHEIATSMYQNLSYELDFLENNVMFSKKKIKDCLVDDPTIPVSRLKGINDVYKD